MRLFLSINFSNRNKKLIQNKVNLLKTKIDEKVKWVKKENWHITVKFLGEVKSDRLAKVKNKINEMKSYENFWNKIQFNDTWLGTTKNRIWLIYRKICNFLIDRNYKVKDLAESIEEWSQD